MDRTWSSAPTRKFLSVTVACAIRHKTDGVAELRLRNSARTVGRQSSATGDGPRKSEEGETSDQGCVGDGVDFDARGGLPLSGAIPRLPSRRAGAVQGRGGGIGN